jgi:hypothetical protein
VSFDSPLAVADFFAIAVDAANAAYEGKPLAHRGKTARRHFRHNRDFIGQFGIVALDELDDFDDITSNLFQSSHHISYFTNY